MNRLQIELDIEGIERLCDRATSGNVAHIIGTIKSYCRMIKEELDVPDWTYYRTQAAIAAMQGIMNSIGSTDNYKETIAELAVEQADALIDKLKEK
jgi:hypothetical protein